MKEYFEEIYYCKDCNKLYKSCYEIEGVLTCSVCWSNIEIIPKDMIIRFIRKIRLKNIFSKEDVQ